MNPLNYLHLQMQLEGKALVNEFLMRQVEVLTEEEMPLMLIAQLANKETVAYYDEAMSSDLQKELAANVREIEFPEINPLLTVLKGNQIDYEVGYYKTYVFPSEPARDMDVIRLSKHDQKVKAFGFDGFAETVYALERAGRIVSACVSARENKQCGEAWVYTDSAYRHLGFALKVVSAWAVSLMEDGKVPFYSHKMENRASANLAGKLGLQPVFEEITIDRSQSCNKHTLKQSGCVVTYSFDRG